MAFRRTVQTALGATLLNGTAFTVPAGLYPALSTADPGPAGAGAALIPASDGFTTSNTLGNWAETAAGSGVYENSGAIALGTVANNAWTNVTHLALYEDAGLTQYWGAFPFPAPVSASIGTVVSIAAGDATLDLTGV